MIFNLRYYIRVNNRITYLKMQEFIYSMGITLKTISHTRILLFYVKLHNFELNYNNFCFSIIV